MSQEEYFQFIVREQRKTVTEAARKDGTHSVYHFYGYYGKIVWTHEDGTWKYEVQPPSSRQK